MSRIRTTKNGINLPPVSIPTTNITTLPFNQSLIKGKSFSFSFACFERCHPLFNLGDSSPEGTLTGNWYIDLLDCFRSINHMTIQEAKVSTHDLHPVDWDSANVAKPAGSEQQEYWQFRISKSKGRIIGILIDSIFFVVWLDPHHNLVDSPGYGKAVYYHAPMSSFEIQEQRISDLEQELRQKSDDLTAANDLLEEAAKKGH